MDIQPIHIIMNYRNGYNSFFIRRICPDQSFAIYALTKKRRMGSSAQRKNDLAYRVAEAYYKAVLDKTRTGS